METCFTNLEPCDITTSKVGTQFVIKKAKLRYYNMFKSDLCQEEYIPPLIYRNMYEMCIHVPWLPGLELGLCPCR